MECSVDTTKVQQEDGSIRGIEIIPKGCYPVSTDVCTSGYMAPVWNVTFPENSLKQCCKCKEGERCPFCDDPDACTDTEKERYVSNENCFGEGSPYGPPPGPSASPSAGPSAGPSPDKKDEDESVVMYIIIGSVVLLTLLLMIFLFSRRTKTI